MAARAVVVARVHRTPEEAFAYNAQQQRAQQLAIVERQRAHEREIQVMKADLEAVVEKATQLRALLGLPRRTINDLPTHLLSRILLSATAHDNLLHHVAICARVCSDWNSIVTASAAFGRGRWPTGDPAGTYEDFVVQTPRAAALMRISRKLRATWTNGGELALAGGDTPIRDAGAAALCAAISALPELRRSKMVLRLDVDGNELTATAMIPVAIALRGLNQLQMLDVRRNPALGDAGLAMLAGALPRTLLHLNFTDTGCGDVGMVAVAAVLPALTRLRTLRCCMNPIGPVGWAALGAALGKAAYPYPGIDIVASQCTGMGDMGVASVAAGLSHVAFLDATDCDVSSAGALALAAALPGATHLRRISLSNTIPPAARATLTAAAVQETESRRRASGERILAIVVEFLPRK
jgi:hypothetical protein